MQLKPVLSMSDATVAEHMQDLYATLLGDLQLLKARRGLSASDLIDLDADRLQCLLSGHPKFAFNKGRRGWGKEALERYAPEYANTFRLHRLAVKREHMVWRCDSELDIQQLLAAAMDPQSLPASIRSGRTTGWITTGCHCRYIRGSGSKISLDFIADLAEGRMVSLGEFGDCVARAAVAAHLTNASRQGGWISQAADHLQHLLLPGIPGKYIAAGPLASRWLQQVLRPTPRLAKRRGDPR